MIYNPVHAAISAALIHTDCTTYPLMYSHAMAVHHVYVCIHTQLVKKEQSTDCHLERTALLNPNISVPLLSNMSDYICLGV